ncbi:hypothetical protein OM076_28685 [Solirubrobacter ginsenosidimutans]|uniref:DUF4337 domain-containing protein n=1 Tax=Solirubrobacter ginsenosidimutans TaxID=490573 RepID=A0A9X3S5K1_9ACTN|nr:hypothetical protein [Solirubrobacter ginsenosidimutans]MDA0164281.1 hypothetical protein [Solirubrobacter ginsenosidimutans]
MPEGLSPAEVGKEIAEHKKHSDAAGDDHDRHDRRLSIVEAVLLSFVAILAAYSGYAAAKWGTESSISLASASAQRTKANRADTEAIVTRTLDSASFNAWFTAFTAGNADAQRLAEKRMRPGYRPAFDAWRATDPEHNPSAPAGPAYMPQYVIPQDAAAKAYDAKADRAFAKGSEAGQTADKYIRATVFLATVLFLVGISGHFRIRQARIGLIVAAGFLLGFAVIQLLGLPGPPA